MSQDKVIQKSIGLSADDWDIIEMIRERNSTSISAVFREMLISTMFLADLKRQDINISMRERVYYNEVVKMDRKKLYERANTPPFPGFHRIKDIEEIATPEEIEASKGLRDALREYYSVIDKS